MLKMAVLRWRIRCAIVKNRKRIFTAAVPALLLFAVFYAGTHHGAGSLGVAEFSLVSVLTSLAVFSWAFVLQLNLKSGARAEQSVKHEKKIQTIHAPAHAVVVESANEVVVEAPRLSSRTRPGRQLA